MDNKELQRLAGIITEEIDMFKEWSNFSKAADRMVVVLKKVAIDTSGQKAAPGMLNPLQISDISHHIEPLEQELERLDVIYHWRDYMAKRKANMSFNK